MVPHSAHTRGASLLAASRCVAAISVLVRASLVVYSYVRGTRATIIRIVVNIYFFPDISAANAVE